jgi:predicted dehydrogenase
MSKKNLRFGIVGCGFIAKQHLIASQENGFKLDFICDLESKKMDEFLLNSNLGSVNKVTNLSEYLLENNVDFVSIATDSGSHFKIAKIVLNRGINILVEKPLTLSTNEIDELINLELMHNSKNGVVFPIRYNESIQKVRKLISNGTLGKVYSIDLKVLLNRNQQYYDQAKWRGTWAKDGGGVLMNQAIHHLDVLTYLIDSKPVSVYSKLSNYNHSYIETEDFASAFIEFENNVVAQVLATTSIFNSNYKESLLLICEKGTLVLTGKGLSKLEIISLENPSILDELVIEYPLKFQNHHSNTFHHYSNYLNGLSKHFPTDFKHSRILLTLVYSIYKSHFSNQKIKLSDYKNYSNNDFLGLKL